MKIVAIEAIPFKLPARRDFKWAGLAVDLGGFVLIRVLTDEGVTGIGEATPLPDWGGDHGRHAGETLKTVCAVVTDVLTPLLKGRDPTRIEEIRIAMAQSLKGNSYARNAVEIALYDILGKVAGLPLYRLLGGACRESVPYAHMVGLMPQKEGLGEALGALEDGVRYLQIKGGVDHERDVALVADIRNKNAEVIIRVDANQGYGTPKNAISLIRRLEQAGANIIEQPVAGHCEMAEVRAAVDVPIMADESCWDAREAMEVVSGKVADYISIYLAKSGGITGARRVSVIAETAGMRCDVNGSIESAIGNAASLAFALSTPVVDLGCVIPVNAPQGQHPCKVAGNYYTDDICKEPFQVRNGELLPLPGAGLGIEIDEAKLQKYRLD